MIPHNATAPLPATLTREQIENLLGEAKLVSKERDLLTARLARAQTRLAQTIATRIQSATLTLEEKEKIITAWAKANRDREFGKEKTLKLLHGDLSFNAGKPKTELLKEFTEKLCIAALKKFRRLKKLFIRPKEELDRAQILKSYAAGDVDDATLAKIGIEVTTTESFSIKLT